MQSFQENHPFIFQARVVLKLLVGRLVACSARISVDTHTDRQTDYCKPSMRMRAERRGFEVITIFYTYNMLLCQFCTVTWRVSNTKYICSIYISSCTHNNAFRFDTHLFAKKLSATCHYVSKYKLTQFRHCIVVNLDFGSHSSSTTKVSQNVKVQGM